MGIQGLFKELSRKGYDGESICLSAKRFSGMSIVVDASALIYKFSAGPWAKWEYCGNFVEIFDRVKEYVSKFRDADINLIVVVDGAVEK